MKMTSAMKASRDKFVAAFPIPTGAPGAAFEDRLRGYTVKLVEQMRFDTRDPNIGTKKADSTRPISKDTVSLTGGGISLTTWDLYTGSGTGNPQLVPDPDSIDTSGQVFVAVNPVDYVGGSSSGGGDTGGDGGQTPGTDYGPQLTRIEQKVDGCLAGNHQLENLLHQLEEANERRYKDVIARTEELKTLIKQGRTGHESGFMGGSITIDPIP